MVKILLAFKIPCVVSVPMAQAGMRAPPTSGRRRGGCLSASPPSGCMGLQRQEAGVRPCRCIPPGGMLELDYPMVITGKGARRPRPPRTSRRSRRCGRPRRSCAPRDSARRMQDGNMPIAAYGAHDRGASVLTRSTPLLVMTDGTGDDDPDDGLSGSETLQIYVIHTEGVAGLIPISPAASPRFTGRSLG